MSRPVRCFALTESEHNYLEKYVRTGKHSARSIQHAQILLKSHSGLRQRDIASVVGRIGG